MVCDRCGLSHEVTTAGCPQVWQQGPAGIHFVNPGHLTVELTPDYEDRLVKKIVDAMLDRVSFASK